MQYSPVCDVDPVAYCFYLLCNYGADVVGDNLECGGDCGDTGVGGRSDFRGRVVGLLSKLVDSSATRLDVVDSLAAVSKCHRRVCGVLGDGGQSGSSEVVGVAGFDAGGSVGSVDDGVGIGVGELDRKESVSGPRGLVRDALVADDDCSGVGASGPVAAKTLANRKRRQDKKARKIRRQKEAVPEWRRGAGAVSSGEQEARSGKSQALRESVEAKWIAKNALEAEEARRKLVVLQANDVQDEVRRYRTRVQRHTEANMVTIEKTHALLKATGNVAGEVPVDVSEVDAEGRIRTVLSGETISPSSSASLQEVRKLQKDLLDSQAEVERLRRGIESVKLDPDVVEYYTKLDWTVKSDGCMEESQQVIADKIFPNGYSELGQPTRRADGKYRVHLVPYYD